MAQGNGVSTMRTGERLRSLRKHLGISAGEAARSAGVSRFELAAYERGVRPVPDSVVGCLARAYGVSPGEVVPSRGTSKLAITGGKLVAGEVHRPLPPDATPEEVLDHYLDFIRQMRGARDLDHLPLRDADLDALAGALGGTPKQIERRLVELIQCSREEARAIRRALLRRRLAVPAAGFVFGLGGLGSAAVLKDDVKPAAAVTDESERARAIDLDVEAPEPVPAEAPAEEVVPPPPVEQPTDSEPTNNSGEPITRSGSGEGDDWAEVIPPVVVSPDDPVR